MPLIDSEITQNEPSWSDPQGRKWIVVEGKDGSEQWIEKIEQPKLTWAGETDQVARERKAREQYRKRVRKHEKPFHWSLGYNNCVGRRSGEDEYPAMTGSSLNRLLRHPDRTKPEPEKDEEEEKENSNEPVEHFFSARSRGKVKDKATAFWRSTSGTRIFLTLSFIQMVSDKEAVGILNKFLTVLRKEMPTVQYLWVAERQENGNIHFHLIVNKFLPVKKYNPLWVLQQYNAGLRGRPKTCGCRKKCSCGKWGDIISQREIEERYRDGTVGEVLNPLDAEQIKTVHGIAWYLTKYITQQDKNASFFCLTWHCSRRVSRLFTREVVAPSAFSYLLSFSNYKINRDTGECWKPVVKTSPYFVMVYVNNKKGPLRYLKRMEQTNKWMMNGFDLNQLPKLTDTLYRKILITPEC